MTTNNEQSVGALLSSFVEAIAQQVRRAEKEAPATLKLAGRHFVREAGGSYKEVEELREDLADHTEIHEVIGIDSLMAWVLAMERDEPGHGGIITISRRRRSEASTPLKARPWDQRERCRMLWYDAFMPPGTIMGPLELRSWLDELGPDRVQEQADVIAEINTLSAASGSMRTIRQTAAVIQLRGESKDEVLGTMRRRILTTIPIGDPGFEVEIEWLLSVRSERGELKLTLGAILEPSLQRWAEWARARIDDIGVPGGWTVLTVA